MDCLQLGASILLIACYSLFWHPYVKWPWVSASAMKVFWPYIWRARGLGEFKNIWIIGTGNTTRWVCVGRRDLDAKLQRWEKTRVKLEGAEVLSLEPAHVHSRKTWLVCTGRVLCGSRLQNQGDEVHPLPWHGSGSLSSISLSGEEKDRGEDSASSWDSLEDGKVWRGQGPSQPL